MGARVLLATRFIENWQRADPHPPGGYRGAENGTPMPLSATASQAVLDRAYGKAPTFSTTDTTQLKRAIDMTDDELAAIASRATLHVVK